MKIDDLGEQKRYQQIPVKQLNHKIGAGNIDFRKALRAIKKAGYNDTFTLEIHCPDLDYLKISRDKLIKIWKSL